MSAGGIGQAIALCIPLALLIWGVCDSRLRGKTRTGRTIFWIAYVIVILLCAIYVRDLYRRPL